MLVIKDQRWTQADDPFDLPSYEEKALEAARFSKDDSWSETFKHLGLTVYLCPDTEPYAYLCKLAVLDYFEIVYCRDLPDLLFLRQALFAAGLKHSRPVIAVHTTSARVCIHVDQITHVVELPSQDERVDVYLVGRPDPVSLSGDDARQFQEEYFEYTIRVRL
jgi:hypothetical protein